MIRFQITGSNPVEMNTAAKILAEQPRLDIDRDSGNSNGRKGGYIRYIHARIKKGAVGRPRSRPVRLDGATKMSLAHQCWQNILHKSLAPGNLRHIVGWRKGLTNPFYKLGCSERALSPLGN